MEHRLATIGIIGGGQLGKMMAQAAGRMGHRVVVLDPTPDCPAAQVSEAQIVAAYNDHAALAELGRRVDRVTYEFENVDAATIKATLPREKMPQWTRALELTQDRVTEKQTVNAAGLDTVEWRDVETLPDLLSAIDALGYPAVLKTRRFGYDGHGQQVLHSAADLPAVRELVAAAPCILEALSPFEYEASIMVARNPRGQVVTMPPSRNEHRNGILHTSTVSSRFDAEVAAAMRRGAEKLADVLELVGVMGIEFFVEKDRLLINEIAPRPHNSGHYSIEACDFSQYDLHVRGILDLPLPPRVHLLRPAVMVNVLGQHLAGTEELKETKFAWHFHDYGKTEVKENRKMGHITILTDDTDATLAEIAATGLWD